MLDRDEDMLISGGRNPFLGKYQVAFSKTGKIMAVKTQMYINCGYSADLSGAVIITFPNFLISINEPADYFHFVLLGAGQSFISLRKFILLSSRRSHRLYVHY